jgi:hypothetical protein
MSDEQEFDRIMASMYSQDLPPVEVVSGEFRAIAKNFFTLPVQLLMDLKQAQLDEDGSDLLLLFDAAEMAFSEADFERMKDLSIRDFLNVIQAWVYFDRGEREPE